MKKVVLLLGVALVIFVLFTDPVGLGTATQTVAGWLKDGGVAVITFVKSVFR